VNIKTTNKIEIPHIQLRIWKKFRINTIPIPRVRRKDNFRLLIILFFLLIPFFNMYSIKNIKRFNKEKIARKLRVINTKIFIQLYSPIWFVGRKLGLLSK
jgi:hypothetical protein